MKYKIVLEKSEPCERYHDGRYREGCGINDRRI
jgi:hypothetical protein